ncbi:hypothetical protein ABN034_30555 [Actinopolymorpha sp. B11F2]|uniref:hypothetical protein n=1 Tax=Actinopolymorpha sp. B11F2 TaxID=3160862 RepID=UPI0032E49C0D
MAVTAGGVSALVALLVSGCVAATWDEIEDYSFTLRLYDGKCGEKPRGAWRLTVVGDEIAGVVALDEVARKGPFIEGAPTLKELYEGALRIKKDGAYDILRIDYETGPHGRRPAGVYFLSRDRGEELCETYTDYQPLPMWY